MMKLKENGITERIWCWIRDFLTDRSAAINFEISRNILRNQKLLTLLLKFKITEYFLALFASSFRVTEEG